MTHETVLVNGARTPFGKYGGALRGVPSVELGAAAMRSAMRAAGIRPADVDEVVYGVTIPAEEALDGSIPARVAMLKAGIPEERLSLTIDRACCSGLTAVQLARRAIAAGEAEIVLAGGSDNMMRAPMLLSPDVRWGVKRGAPSIKDPMHEPGADIGGKPIAVDAGEVAMEHGITREMSDDWAMRSHARYFEAFDVGFYDDEVVAFEVPNGAAGHLVEHDEGPRRDSSREKLASLGTVYGGPIVTPGNAPGQNAGACFVVVASAAAAERLGLDPLGRIPSVASIARAPREIAVAPAPAIVKALQPAGWDIDSIDLIEINEAFACVPLTSARVLADGDADREQSIIKRLNVNGGSVAIGHPAGATGARLLLTMARELRRRGGGRGVVAICGGLGQGDAATIEVG
jgi:acetyl-CoA C-acetyltransferase